MGEETIEQEAQRLIRLARDSGGHVAASALSAAVGCEGAPWGDALREAIRLRRLADADGAK